MNFLFVFSVYFVAVFSGIGADDDTHSRHKRASLGLEVAHNFCQHLGRSCGLTRDNVNKPKKVILTPCCKHLKCVGITANSNSVPSTFPELIVSKLSNNPPDNTIFSGICTLGLDNNEAYTEFDAYKKYVAGLSKID